jgi:hypothetical protein
VAAGGLGQRRDLVLQRGPEHVAVDLALPDRAAPRGFRGRRRRAPRNPARRVPKNQKVCRVMRSGSRVSSPRHVQRPTSRPAR